MRCPVLRLIWLKLIFSDSEVAGNRATGQVTSERRRKPFQLARGAIENSIRNGLKTAERDSISRAAKRSESKAERAGVSVVVQFLLCSCQVAVGMILLCFVPVISGAGVDLQRHRQQHRREWRILHHMLYDRQRCRDLLVRHFKNQLVMDL